MPTFRSSCYTSARTFHELRKVMGYSQSYASSAAFLFDVPGGNSPLVVQERQIGGTRPDPDPARRGALKKGSVTCNCDAWFAVSYLLAALWHARRNRTTRPNNVNALRSATGTMTRRISANAWTCARRACGAIPSPATLHASFGAQPSGACRISGSGVTRRRVPYVEQVALGSARQPTFHFGSWDF